MIFLTHLWNFNVSACVNLEEEILISCKLLNPSSEIWLMQKSEVSFCLEILAFVSEEHLLEISVVENIWVHCPPSVFGFVLIISKSKCVISHEGYVLLWLKTHEFELLNLHGILVGYSWYSHCITYFVFILKVNTSHSEDHAWSSAILDGGDASKL